MESISSTKHDVEIMVCISLNHFFLLAICYQPKILLSCCSFFSCFLWLLCCFFQISFICKNKFRNFIRDYLFFSTRDIPCDILKRRPAAWLQLPYNPAVEECKCNKWKVSPLLYCLPNLYDKPPKHCIVSCWHAGMVHISFLGDKILTFHQCYGITFRQ